MKTELDNKRIIWIDAIKGCGICLVMLSHSQSCPYIALWLCAGYMPMFFIAAGYTVKCEKIGKYITSKANRLLIPYFIYGIMVITIASIVAIFNNGSIKSLAYNWLGLIYSRHSLYYGGHPLLGSYNAPLWFLTCMFMAYLWTSFYLKMHTITQKVTLILLYISISAVFSKIPFLLPWSIDTSFMGSLFIISGFELRKSLYFKNKKQIVDFVLIVFMLIVYIPLVYYNGNINMSIKIYGNIPYWCIMYFYIIGMFATIIYGNIFRILNKTFITRIFAKIGKHSLTIMCIHLPLMFILNSFFDKFISRHMHVNIYIITTIEIFAIITFCIYWDHIKTKLFANKSILKWL